jgi:co-chaperonin GroES (HSP10)
MQLSTLNDDTTSIDDKDPDISGLHILGHQLLLRPVSVDDKTSSGMAIPKKTQHDVAYLMNVCKVLAMGPMAYTQDVFKHPETGETVPYCKVGDFVMVPRLGGQKIKYKGVPLTIISCDRPMLRVDNPREIDPNFNISTESAL